MLALSKCVLQTITIFSFSIQFISNNSSFILFIVHYLFYFIYQYLFLIFFFLEKKLINIFFCKFYKLARFKLLHQATLLDVNLLRLGKIFFLINSRKYEKQLEKSCTIVKIKKKKKKNKTLISSLFYFIFYLNWNKGGKARKIPFTFQNFNDLFFFWFSWIDRLLALRIESDSFVHSSWINRSIDFIR